MGIPAPLRSGRFDLYWTGVVLTEIGTRGTFMANLFHMYQLTGSTLQTGLIGLFQAVALIVLSPLGGAWADRVDRRRIVQLMQCLALLVSLGLAAFTLADMMRPALILVAVLLNTAAETFDRPARQAIIPALVPRKDLVKAFALVNPSREVAILVGPALAGFLIAGFGPAGMYIADAVSFVALIVIMQFIRVPALPGEARRVSVLTNIREGFAWLRRRSLILQLIGLDLICTLFGAYRAVLPALATDVLHAGASGFGLLAAAPAVGALAGSALVFPLIDKVRSGPLVLAATAAYGLMAIGLGQAPIFILALVAAAGLGLCDALHTTVRQAAVQIETPDGMRGRVTSTYQIASRGGPALGDLNIGGVAGLMGPVAALSLGGMVPIAAAVAVAAKGKLVRGYQVPAHESA